MLGKRLLPISLILLTGCGSVPDLPGDCISIAVPDRSPEFELRLADELDALPENTALEVVAVQDENLRNEVLACQNNLRR
jgi:hypothetical protein